MLAHIDHIVYAVSDLNSGIEWIEAQLGVRPQLGGKHHVWGTHNAILGLGEGAYLEVIAPDPDLEPPAAGIPNVFSSKGSDRISTWAAKCSNIEQVQTRAHRAGLNLGKTVTGSRIRGDGSKLRWSLTDPITEVMNGLVPFFIDWGKSIHPSVGAPEGCRLKSLRAESVSPEELRNAYASLGVGIDVVEGSTSSLFADIATPTGEVTLR